MHTLLPQHCDPFDVHTGLIKRRRAQLSTNRADQCGLIESLSPRKPFALRRLRRQRRACAIHAAAILSPPDTVTKKVWVDPSRGSNVIITSKSDYGLRAVLYLAECTGRVRLREISASQHIPESVCAQIMRKLVAAQIVLSQAGPAGGYTLARSPETISVASVLSASDRDICIFRCVEDGCDCDLDGKCAFQMVLKGFGKGIADYLDHLSLADLREQNGKLPEFHLPALTAGKAS